MSGEERTGFATRHPRVFLAAVLLIFLCAFLVRMYRINEAPRDFWTVRQYNGALIARALYFDMDPSVPDGRREVARGYSRWFAEPPVLEWVSALAFRFLKAEVFWMPRLVTTLAWVVGGWGLWMAASRLFSRAGSLVATIFYLFLPYSVGASRSWMPDPVMTAGLCFYLWSLTCYFQSLSKRTLWNCIACAALTTLVKPGGSLLIVVGAFGMLSILKRGLRRTVLGADAWSFAVGTVLPSALVMGWAVKQGWYKPAGHFATYLSPQLLTSLYFWKGWAGILLDMMGFPVLVVCVVGFILAGRNSARPLMLAYGAGYVAQCLLYTFTTPSHDYWHMPLIPLAGLLLGSVADFLWSGVRGDARRGMRRSLVIALAVISLATSVVAIARDVVRPVQTAYQDMCREIGAAVGHSRRVVFLDYDVGNSLKYFAEIDGWYWPESELMAHHRLGYGQRAAPETRPELSAADRFTQYYATNHPDYFVICRAMQELDRQPGLRDFLFSNYPVITNGDRFVVFDLRQTKTLDEP